ncbi:transposase [Buttiauxella brennerae]|uniref:transposase n=1 Tax=Buttiauxella brennerae TaxID=82988 RepID=UPI00286FAD31|nr:transposase [Buttiauxella brennerae]
MYKERKRRPGQEIKGRASAKSPWLIFTNTAEYSAKQVMKIYSRRMQIEQNFRDEKSARYGFGLRDGGSQTVGRLSVLSLIATLASIIICLSCYIF